MAFRAKRFEVRLSAPPSPTPLTRPPADAHPDALPPWLSRAISSRSHFRQVVAVLAAREAERRSYMLRSGRYSASKHLPADPQDPLERYAICAGLEARNQGRNRYADLIVPYDYNRTKGVGGEDGYLNASWVREVHGGKWWCAAQAPMPVSFYDFLSLCVQPTAPPGSNAPPSRIPIIIQLTRDVEACRRKAHPYLPEGGDNYGSMVSFDPSAQPISVQVVSRERIADSQTVHSRLMLSGQHVVDHYLYEGWPDHGVPDSCLPLIALARLVDEATPFDVPLLVHCSAGIGRTGSFIAICSLLRHHGFLRGGPTVHPMASPLGAIGEPLAEDEVLKEIDGLRDQRTGMVQRDEQVDWIYRTLAEALISRAKESQA